LLMAAVNTVAASSAERKDGFPYRNQSALLVMDLQTMMIAFAFGDKTTERDAYVARVKSAITAARQSSMPIIYVVVQFTKDYAHVCKDNKMFGTIVSSGRLVAGSESAKIIDELSPQEGDTVVVKRRVSAFFGTDLAPLLSAKNIKHVVLCGIATSGVVLSTVRHAADSDYVVSVLEDACVDMDEEVHRVLTTKVFARQATVYTVQQFVASLRGLATGAADGNGSAIGASSNKTIASAK